jgi:hypothetical protein
MGIRFTCPNGHKLHVKAFLAGKRGVCPQCGAKILIPSVEEPQPLAAAHSPGSAGKSNQFEAVPSNRDHTADIGSQSIIIAVAEKPLAQAPPPAAEQSGAVRIQSGAAVDAATPPAPPPPSVIVTESMPPVSPAVRYVAHRERSRRNQLTIAVTLLVAVIVLAIVLLWVLQRGSGQTSAGRIPNRLTNYRDLPTVALDVAYKNAHRERIATT